MTRGSMAPALTSLRSAAVRTILVVVSLFLGMALRTAVVRADDEGVTVAKKLAASTVTVRASAPESEPGKTPEVTVFSGVSLGGGLIVTFSSAAETWRYRLTLPDGTQVEA